ncbi:MAG: GFA family protein [Hyphomicrobiales bacterium]
MSEEIRKGSCLCGGVTYEITGPMRDVINCHCIQCRKQTGHFMAATRADTANFKLTKDETLKWYRASDTAMRAFCDTCSATLFWQADDNKEKISIAAGTLDGETGLTTQSDIYVDWKGDYYELSEDVPHYSESD